MLTLVKSPFPWFQVILDSSALEGVSVARMLRTRALSHGVEDFPSLYRLQSNGQLQHKARYQPTLHSIFNIFRRLEFTQMLLLPP